MSRIKRTYKNRNYKPLKLERFYKSDRWHEARRQVILRDKGMCQMCGDVGTQVHHKIHLTIRNVDDPEVATNPDNLILLCDHCHNEVHHRVGKHMQYKFDEDGNIIPRQKK